MESRIRRFFLSASLGLALLCVVPSNATAEEAEYVGGIIQPQIDRREITEADIDEENFEVGAYFGLMSVEDFGVNSVKGVRVAYHVSEWAFLEGVYGQTTIGLSSNERYSGIAPLMSDDLRETRYYYMTLGLNLLPGEAFMRGRAFNSSLYVVAGLGSTEFGGDPRSSTLYGVGYRLLLTDWLALHLDSRVHRFDIEMQGEAQSLTNIESHASLTVFF